MAGGKVRSGNTLATDDSFLDTRFTLENNPGLGVRASARLPNHP